MRKTVVAVLALGVVGGAGYGYYRYSRQPVAPTVTTSAVTRGDVIETVGATGTLQAVTTVQVGSQVSGNIAFLGADFNSLVKKGQVLARLDPSLFEAQAQQSRANLSQSRANLTKAQSDLERTRVQLVDAQQKFARARELSTRGLLPQSDLDAAKTAVDTAQAALQSQQATVVQVQAAITQSEASVNQAQVNLAHTVIEAPIDGLVISRNVDVGQTVAASMQAPTLFVLAADLTKMQVLANLDESDVGRIRPNQVVTFRVDAYPDDTFHGTVSQVRLQPVVQQNVVTYATVIDVPNNDLRLKPGMTANVNVQIARATNVLRIPNSALRFRPSNEVFAALGQTPPEPQGRGLGGGGRRGGTSGEPAAGAAGALAGRGALAGGSPAPGGSSPAGGDTGGGAPSTASANQPAGVPVQPGRATAAGDERPAARVDTTLPTAGAAAAVRSGAEGSVPLPGDGAGARGGFGRRGGGGAPGADVGNSSGAAGQGDALTDADRRSRFAERMQNLPPEEREARLARMRERGLDPGDPGLGFRGRGGRDGGGRDGGGGRGGGPGPAASDAGANGGRGGGSGLPAAAGAPAPASAAGRRSGDVRATGAPAARASGATTIDALFAPLPRTETIGRAWLFAENQLRQVRLRLGISDGQNTEVIEGDVKEGTEVVTNVAIAGQSTRPATTAFPGFGQPGRGGFPGGGFQGGGARGGAGGR